MTYTAQQLEEKYQSLPEDIREVMIGVETAKVVGAIGQTHRLRIDQMGELADEIGLTMLGLTKPDEFLTHIKNRLQIDQTAAEQITREVNEQIFLPIRESLQKLHEVKEAVIVYLPKPGIPADELPDKEKLLEEIENPTPSAGQAPKTERDTIFEKKLGQLFRIPREEVDLDPYLEKPE